MKFERVKPVVLSSAKIMKYWYAVNVKRKKRDKEKKHFYYTLTKKCAPRQQNSPSKQLFCERYFL